ncbi:ER membrane protein complex subunit 7 [Galendromus occidentalis]|uniref:ER membrane protein complex subunit 7 n=1 Tax=Galendromus occidentalis TaxID=34638 RepID=A0AAJ6VVN3_9ACAR|nr:ER membrane protein complex subunit 7 [Galendromus occidentalis]
MTRLPHSILMFGVLLAAAVTSADEGASGDAEYTIEGKLAISPHQDNFTDILEATQILVDGGQHIGFLKDDYSFEIRNVVPGSYLVQVSHPLINFEPVRVDISSKGAKRARRVNNVQPHLNNHLPYPLKIKVLGLHNYFQQRETWSATDFIFHPMVWTMGLPVLLIMVLPKMMSAEDMAQTQREVQQMQNAARMPAVPELSEMMTSFLGQRPPQRGGASNTNNRNRNERIRHD